MNIGNKKWIGIGLLVLSIGILGLTLKLHVDVCRERNNKVTCDTPEQAYKYVKEHSNIFSDSILCETPVMWPQENFIIDLTAKAIMYCSGKDTITIKYTNIQGKGACKKFEVDPSNAKLKTAIETCSQSISIDSTYEKQIKENKTLDELNQKLSRIYNILAGNEGGHVILGRCSSDAWKCYQLEDFPIYFIDKDKLLGFVQYHLKHKDLSPKECYVKNIFINQQKDLGIVYYDIRRNKVIEQNGIVKKDQGEPLSHNLNTLKLSKGWLNYRVKNKDGNLEWRLESAYDYFVGSKRTYVKFGSPKGRTLETAQWEKPHTTPMWIMIVLYSLSGVMALAGLVFLLIDIFPLEKKNKDENFGTRPKDNSNSTTVPNRENVGIELTIVAPKPDELVTDEPISSDEVKTLKDKIAALEKEIQILSKRPTSKQVEELEKQVEELKKRPTPKQVKELKEQAVEEYKRDNDIDNQLKRAKNWKTLVTTESVKRVNEILDQIRVNHPKFPQLETLKSVYDSAVDSSKDLLEQMRYVISHIEKQVNSTSNWQQRFDKMCGAETYANKVRKQYDAIELYVQGVEKRGEIKQVLGKDNLNYLDRIALSNWSIEGFNTLMTIFEQPHLSKENEKSLQESLYFDMLQLLMTRVFFIYNADGKPTPVFKSDLRKMLDERLNTLENEYHLRSSKRDKINETAQSLDDSYDQMRSTDEFVNRMYDTFVKEFSEKADSNKEKAWFFGMMVAMGYHTVDFVRRKKNISINLCPNYAYLLTDFDNSKLPEESYFKYKDYAHSVEYSNRIYEWLDEMGVQHMKALVGRQLVKP